MKNNNKFSKNERGQALIIITFAIIGLIGLTGLTVDGGMAYADRRHAQNAADSAALAAALAHVREVDPEDAAKDIAATNGYIDTAVTVTTSDDLPADACPAGTLNNIDITVQIVSHVDTTFATIVGIRQMTNNVFATSRACGTYIAPIFGGNAIVSINPDPDECAFDSDTGSAEWVITGGGIFSNGCAVGQNNPGQGYNITLDTDPYQCVAAAAGATDFENVCPGTPAIYDQTYIDGTMPPNPCVAGGVGKPQLAVVGNGNSQSVTLQDGVYCITDFDAYDSVDIKLNNATLYVTDPVFKLQFAGGGGFSGTPTESGTYSSYFMIIKPTNNNKCTDFQSNNHQVVNYRGNSGGDIPFGTVLAPTACIDLRGNGAATINGQVIGYSVSANGNAGATINYVDDQNRRDPVDPAIQLLK